MTDIMLFAAGRGTRMTPLTDDCPKPMIPVAGKPLIDHALALTSIPEIDRIVVNAHYKADQIKAHLRDKTVSVSNETDLLRDTGGGLKHALPLLDSDPLLTLNTDAVWAGANPIPQILRAWRDTMDCLLLVVPKTQARGHAGAGNLHLAPDGALTFGEGYINTGLHMIRRAALAPYDQAVFSLREVWLDAAAKGRLFGVCYTGLWCDVGTPSGIPIAEDMLRSRTDV